MSTLLRLPISPDNLAAYRFGRAELQLAAERLLVDGREVPLAPMAYRFLLCLCQARGGLLARAHVFDILWPGGGSGSDEALAQIVLKVRQALGEEGRSIVTVRGRGFRLDVPVEPVPLARLEVVRTAEPPTAAQPVALMSSTALEGPAATSEPPAPTVVPSTPRTPSWRRLRWLVLMAVLVAVAAMIVVIAPWRDRNPVLPGYGFRAADLGPISAQGIESLRLVQLRDDEGDRTSAEQLLRALIGSEPHSAVPAFFLALWTSGTADEVRQWQNLLRERLPAQSGAYPQLLVRWVTLDGDDAAGAESEILNAALKLEPSAWRLHLSRAHVMLRQLRFDAALADLRQVPLQGLAPRHAMFVMADRASLGDSEAVQAALPDLAVAAPAMADYVRGRIGLARGQWADAQAAFEASAQRADQDALIGALSRSWLFGSVAAGARQDWEAMERDAAQARRIGVQHERDDLVADAEWLIGYAQLRRGAAAGIASLDRAAAVATSSNDRDGAIRLWLQRARLQPAWGLAQPAPALTDQGLTPGLAALVGARRAWLDCDTAAATQALADAEGRDVRNSYWADELDLLRQDLALATAGSLAAPALPYPWLSRWITYWESGRNPGARACARPGALPARAAHDLLAQPPG